MKMNKTKKILLIAIFASNLHAFDMDLSSFGGDSIGDFGSSINNMNLSGQFMSGITSQATNCINDSITRSLSKLNIWKIQAELEKLNLEINDISVNENISNNINLLLGGAYGGGSISGGIAGCTFSIQKPKVSGCLSLDLNQELSASFVAKAKTKIKLGIPNYMTVASADLADIASSEIFNKPLLTDEEKKQKMPEHTSVYGNNDYEKTLHLNNDGKYINSRVGKGVLKCIEDAKTRGYDEKSCYPNYDNLNSDETNVQVSEVEIREAIHKEALVTLATPLRNNTSDSRNIEADLSSKISSKCGDKTSLSSAENCMTNYLKNDYKIVEKTTELKADISKNIAALENVIDTATTPVETIVFPTEYTASKLPIEKRTEYRIKSARSIAQRALIKSQFKKIAEIERELADIMSRKKEVASRPFFSKAVANELGIN